MKEKTFDAVEMKNAIQAEHRRRRAGMSDEQARESISARLEKSDHALARKWRRLTADRISRSSTSSPQA